MDEFDLQCNLADYLRLQYPGVLFNSDLGGLRLPIGQAVKVKRLRQGRGWPDLFISEPRGGYLGLFLELKTDRTKIYTKAGQLHQNQHTLEQHEVLMALQARGYKARFACGFDEATGIIDEYLEGPPK